MRGNYKQNKLSFSGRRRHFYSTVMEIAGRRQEVLNDGFQWQLPTSQDLLMSHQTPDKQLLRHLTHIHWRSVAETH